ncbi:MAG: hypothetical protein IIY75_05165, partial [Erysipelotrichales bacterium]|nr:hypothetical protein [Erysipelotrichales bacterium]
MKKITRFLLAVLLVVVLVPARITKVSAAGIPINAVNFPDIVFMQYVQWGLFGGKSEITADEAASIKTIELGAASGGEGLQSLEGICYFPNLETIIISDAQV